MPELSPHIWLDRLASLWGYYAGTGKDIAFADGWLPIVATDALLARLGADALALNHLWLAAFFLLQALGVCFLYRTLFAGHGPVISSLFAGLASILNPFVLITFHSPYLPSALAIALSPWLVALFLRNLQGRSWALLAAFVLVCSFDVVADVNVAYVALQSVILLILMLYSLAQRNVPEAKRRAVGLALIFACVHAPVLWAIAQNLSTQMAEVGRTMHEYSAGTSGTVAGTSTLWNVARLIGTVLFFRDVGGKPFLIGSEAYAKNALVIACSCGLPALAFSALLLRVRGRRLVAAIIAITALSLVAANGGAPPFGAMFSWALVHVPGFQTFRDPFSKFGWIAVAGYALAGACTIDALAQRRSSVYAALAAVAFAGLAGSAFPMFARQLFWEQMKVALPPAYPALASRLNGARGPERLMQSPVSPTLFETYAWGYVGSGVLLNLVSQPIANRAGAFESVATEKLLALLEHNGEDVGAAEAQRVLALLDFGLIVDDASFYAGYFEPTDVEHIGPGDSALYRRQATLGQLTTYRLTIARTKLVYSAVRAIRGVRSYDDMGVACRLTSCQRTVFLGQSAGDANAAFFEAVKPRVATPAWLTRHGPGIVAFRGPSPGHDEADSLVMGIPRVRGAVQLALARVKHPPSVRPWSQPVENPWLGGKSSIVWDRMSPDVHIIRLAERADIHARIDHAMPDQRYQIVFRVSDGLDRSALIMVTDAKLRPLANAQVGDSVQSGTIRFSFRNPKENRVCYLYLYMPKAGSTPVDITISGARIERVGLGAEVVTIQKPMELPAPRGLSYQRRPDGYDVAVQDAPKSYVMVFNATANPNWTLDVPPGVTATRVPANLYEQAWLVRGSGTYSARIRYLPDSQRPVVIALCAAGLLTALALAAYPSRTSGSQSDVALGR